MVGTPLENLAPQNNRGVLKFSALLAITHPPDQNSETAPEYFCHSKNYYIFHSIFEFYHI
jgi:hypothetical protein